MGCTGPTRNDAVIEDVRYIYTHPSPSQLQKRSRVPCVLRSTGWGMRRLTTEEIAGAMGLPPRPIVEAFSRAAKKSKELLTYFLMLTPVKALQFYFVLGLGIGRTVIPRQKNNGINSLTPICRLMDENIFSIDIQTLHQKSVKEDDAELETGI